MLGLGPGVKKKGGAVRFTDVRKKIKHSDRLRIRANESTEKTIRKSLLSRGKRGKKGGGEVNTHDPSAARTKPGAALARKIPRAQHLG